MKKKGKQKVGKEKKEKGGGECYPNPSNICGNPYIWTCVTVKLGFWGLHGETVRVGLSRAFHVKLCKEGEGAKGTKGRRGETENEKERKTEMGKREKRKRGGECYPNPSNICGNLFLLFNPQQHLRKFLYFCYPTPSNIWGNSYISATQPLAIFEGLQWTKKKGKLKRGKKEEKSKREESERKKKAV